MHVSHHNGKSDRTIRRHKKAKRDLEEQGFFSLPEFFKRKAESARLQEAVRNKECEDKANEELHEDNEGDEVEVMGSMWSVEGGTVSIHMLKEGDEADKADNNEAMGGLCSAKGGATLIRLKEEEEETDPEDEAGKMTGVCSAEGGTTLIHKLSSGDPSDSEQELESYWGPSRKILYESEESSSSSGSSDTLSDVEDLRGTDTRELEGIRHGNAPDDTTTQHHMGNVTELL